MSTAPRAPPSADLDLFAARVREYGATVIRTGPGDVAAHVTAALRHRGARRVVVPAGFPVDWEPEAELLRDDPPLTTQELDTVDGVITSCAVAVAETGTVVLDHGAGRAGALSRWFRTITSSSSEPSRWWPWYRTASPPWIRPDRRPGSVARARRATSSCAGSRAYTAPERSTSCSPADQVDEGQSASAFSGSATHAENTGRPSHGLSSDSTVATTA